MMVRVLSHVGVMLRGRMAEALTRYTTLVSAPAFRLERVESEEVGMSTRLLTRGGHDLEAFGPIIFRVAFFKRITLELFGASLSRFSICFPTTAKAFFVLWFIG